MTAGISAQWRLGRSIRRLHINYWPLAVAPLAVAASVGLSLLWPEGFRRLQVWLELPAPYLVGLAAAIYTARAIVTGNPLYVILAVFGAALTCREFHFSGTHRGIYFALVGVGVWAILWRRRLRWSLRDRRHTSWLVATIAAYFLSQFIARRAFKFIPGEQPIHRPLEECAETAAHLMFIFTALIGTWRRHRRPART